MMIIMGLMLKKNSVALISLIMRFLKLAIIGLILHILHIQCGIKIMDFNTSNLRSKVSPYEVPKAAVANAKVLLTIKFVD